jgi:hypothetical protein
MAHVKPRIAMTPEERERVADELARHCAETGVDVESKKVMQWREAVESTLEVPVRRLRPLESRAGRLRQRWLRFRRRRSQ